jgi:hypothetical protein
MSTTFQRLQQDKATIKKLRAQLRKLKKEFRAFDMAVNFTGNSDESNDTDEFDVTGSRGQYMKLRRAFDAI